MLNFSLAQLPTRYERFVDLSDLLQRYFNVVDLFYTITEKFTVELDGKSATG